MKALTDTQYIRQLVSEGEHCHQDFKFEISDARKIARSLSAFANTEGGRLLIGVKDNGKIAGVRSDEEIYMIESLQRTDRWREFFIKMSNDAFIFQNEVSDFAAVAFDSKQSTVVRIKQLFKETGSTYTAINLYLEERRKQYG
jgi:predicted HTH transcriptional regulator